MDNIDLEARRAARKLIAISLAFGIVLGIPIGLTIAWYNIDRVVVITPCEGIEI